MSDHMPECPMLDKRYQKHPLENCDYCNMLRACEQRVIEDRAWDTHAREIEAHAREQAFTDARNAVPHDEGCLSNDADADDRDCNCWQPIALAAIDALRGES